MVTSTAVYVSTLANVAGQPFLLGTYAIDTRVSVERVQGDETLNNRQRS
jgi:hypothetical protein